MIIYINYDKQTGQISVNNDEYPDDPTMLVVNSGTIVDNNNGVNFEIAFNITRFQEVEPPLYPAPNEEI